MRNPRFRCLLAVAAVSLAWAAPAAAQSELSDQQVIRDLIHYQKIDQREAFKVLAAELLSRGIDSVAFVKLLEESGESNRFNEAIPAAMQDPELEELAARLYRLHEDGKLEMARRPDEIARNIAMLTGQIRGRLLSRERLVAAGEYVMPQLLEAYLGSDKTELKARIQRVLIDLGRQAIQPLAAALPQVGPEHQENIVTVLGLIGYQTAMPYLADIGAGTQSDGVRDAVALAISRLGGQGIVLDVSELYYELANDYYDQRRGLTSFPGEPSQLLWNYDPGIGLLMTSIRTEVFHEAMAMRAAERSLRLRNQNPDALALWISANFSREIDSPSGYENPAYPNDRREPMYFAVASGVDVSQLILARGLDDRDTPLIRRAISAIEQTAGGATLWGGPGVRRPLLEALTYPNRRVQYDAALALGSAQPTTQFEGAERVVPTLAGAIRDPSSRYAVVLTSDGERYAALRGQLAGMGYNVLPRAISLAALADIIAEAPGIDLLVLSLTTDATIEAAKLARAAPKLSATPILALVSSQDYTRLHRRYATIQGVVLRPIGIDDAQFSASIEALVRVTTGGPIDAAEGRDYAQRSLAVLRDLALSQSPVLSVADATAPLIVSLGEYQGALRLQIADVLSRIGQQRSQVALMDAGLNASGGEQIDLLALVADSAKRFGNMLTDRQIRRLVDLALSGDQAQGTAAAALMGALNLPNERLLPLVIGESE